jgi:hypothetical protein
VARIHPQGAWTRLAVRDAIVSTSPIIYTCDACGKTREHNGDAKEAIGWRSISIQSTHFGPKYNRVNMDDTHACSDACAAALLRGEADRLVGKEEAT